ncbi:MAG: chloride channel protein [Anaerovoracaceae bacterium]|jgi:H+/Cl- antiporter ClcA
MYNFAGIKTSKGVSGVLEEVRQEDEVSPAYIPIIFASSVITHLFGGSAGREGAALQLGSCIGEEMGRLFMMDSSDMSIMVLSGAASVFASLFCTPLTATIFAMEVVSVGVMYYGALLPCLVSSLVAYTIARMAGLSASQWAVVTIPGLDVYIAFKVALLGLLCAGLAIVIVLAFKHLGIYVRKRIKNRYLMLAAGGVLMILLTLAFPSGNYNGSGIDVITGALKGDAQWYDFLIKLLFTGICLGFGYKGGEIIPVMFIGATFGCVFGPLIGLDPGFAAAICLVATFCGTVNCPVASIILGIEFFGGSGIIYYATACAISFLMSGYYGLYGSQKILYSKTTAKFINRRAH